MAKVLWLILTVILKFSLEFKKNELYIIEKELIRFSNQVIFMLK